MEINSQNLTSDVQEKNTKIKVGIIPLVLGLGLLVSLFLVVILIKERKNLNFYVADLQKQIEQLKKEKDKNSNFINIQPKIEEVEATPTINQEIYTCDYWKNKKYDNNEFYSPAGTITVNGLIVKRVRDKSWVEGEKVTKIYLAVSKSEDNTQKLFYETYRNLVVRQNSVNETDGQLLLFNLGTLEDSKLVSDSNITNDLKNKIISIIDKNESIRLKITIPIQYGTSVTETFSFACQISE